MTEGQQERKVAKNNYRKLKKDNPVRFREDRDKLIKAFTTAAIPKWGSLVFKLAKM